ncbi:6022_t:CDS:1, partial [Paraglomus occultum]
MPSSSPGSANAAATGVTGSGSDSQQSAIENDLNILLIQVKKLFENSKFLDDSALQAFVRALCRLSALTSGIPVDSTLI